MSIIILMAEGYVVSNSDDILQGQSNALDELPMRPAAGRVGTCFCSASTTYFCFQQTP